jgi:F0F1-type ATP synthase membrane subunit a
MILVHLFIGILCASFFYFLVRYTQRKEIVISKWQWLLTLVEISYLIFVFELIASFIEEGSPKAALVMGTIFGFIAIIGAVLLGRFVFSIKDLKTK